VAPRNHPHKQNKKKKKHQRRVGRVRADGPTWVRKDHDSGKNDAPRRLTLP